MENPSLYSTFSITSLFYIQLIYSFSVISIHAPIRILHHLTFTYFITSNVITWAFINQRAILVHAEIINHTLLSVLKNNRAASSVKESHK